MRNTPFDVTALLTEVMERISNEELTDEALTQEINRGKAIADISKNVLAVWHLQLNVARAKDEALRPESFDLPSSLKL